MNIALKSFRRRWFIVTTLILVFIAHLYAITNPPLDLHSWRQVDTTSVARNFAEESPNILLPRIDMRGPYSGITGMEFPLYNYLLFGINKVLGFAHWHGRLITVIVSLFGIGYFYALSRLRYNILTSYVATTTLCIMPLWFYFSRNIQPDILMVSLSIAALYYTQLYAVTQKNIKLLFALIALSLACLVKVPAVIICLPMLYILGRKNLRLLLNLRNIAIAALVFVAPVLAWYIQSAHLSASYGLGQYYYGELNLRESLILIRGSNFWHVLSLYITPLSYTSFLLYLSILAGTVYAITKRDFLPLLWAAGGLIFLSVFANKSFYHNYYSLLLVPSLSLLAGIGASWICKVLRDESKLLPYVFVGMYLLLFAYASFKLITPFYVLSNYEYSRLESIMNQISSPVDRVIVNGPGDPRMLYFSHRKGWVLSGSLLNKANTESLHSQGAKFAIQDTSYDSQTKTDKIFSDVVYKDNDFIIYRLR